MKVTVYLWEVAVATFLISIIACRAGVELALPPERPVPVLTAPSVDRGVTYVA